MKKNVPGDQVEEFLQNAFKAYQESPSEEVWERIAANTKVPPTGRLGIKLPYQAWIGLAAAVFIGIILYQTIHVNQTLNHINRSVQAQQAEIQKLQQQNQSTEHKKTIPQASLDPIRSGNPEDTAAHFEQRTANSQGLIEEPVSPNFTISKKQRPLISNRAIKQSNTANSTVAYRANPLVSQPSSETIYPDSSIPTVGATSSEATSPAVVNEKITALIELNQLADRQNQIPFTKAQEAIHIPEVLPLPIKPASAKSGFYVGAGVLPMRYWSRVSPAKSYSMPSHERKEFNQMDEHNGNAMAMGLSIGKTLGKHWSIESGVLYRNSSITATHEPKFKFKDRRFPPSNDPHHAHFEYNLNTPTGTVALAINVESNSIAIPDEEEIDLKITSEQSLAHLSVPLLLNYQIGNSRLHLNAKGGVLTSFLLDSDFTVTKVHSTNINFQPEPNRPYESKSLYFNNLSLDYLLQFGVAYDLTRNWSVHISPTFIGSLSNPSSNRFIQSSNASAGVSAGVTWGF